MRNIPDSRLIEEIAGDVPAYNPVFAVEAAKLCLDKSGKFAGVVLKAQSWYPDDCNRFLSVPARAIAEAARNDMLATWGTRERFWDDMVLGGACQIINFGNKSRAGLHIDTVGNRSPIQCEAPIGFPHSREALSRKEPFATDELEFSSPAALRDALRPFGKTWQLRLLHDIQFDKESGFVDFCGYDPIARENHNVLVPKSLYETAGKFLFPGGYYNLHGVYPVSWSAFHKPEHVMFGNIIPRPTRFRIFVPDTERGVQEEIVSKKPCLGVRVLEPSGYEKMSISLTGTRTQLWQVLRHLHHRIGHIEAVRTGATRLNLTAPISCLFQGPTAG